MAVYKVPQDVEAEDKLLGPFTFRQFIYLMAAGIAILLAFGLGRIFIGLIVIPLPFILFFLVLALPLKKDQPMETYLTAIIRFWMKPRLRLWDPEGFTTNVQIVSVTNAAASLTKDFTGDEAAQRLQYLSQIVDTGGWASRGMSSGFSHSNLHLSDTLVAEAQSAPDFLDDSSGVAQNFDNMISRNDAAYRSELMNSMQASVNPIQTPQPSPQVVTVPSAPILDNSSPQTTPYVQPTDDDSQGLKFNPYPSAIRQKVIDPNGLAEPSQATGIPQTPQPEPLPESQIQAQAPSPKAISPDIIRLATNKDLSISTLAREAQRLQEKDSEEVVVSLR